MKQPVLNSNDATAVHALMWARSRIQSSGVPPAQEVRVEINAVTQSPIVAILDLVSKKVTVIHEFRAHEYPTLSEFGYHHGVQQPAVRYESRGLEEARARTSALRLFLIDKCVGYAEYLKLSSRAHEASSYRKGTTNLATILRAERDAAAQALTERRQLYTREFYHLWQHDRKAVNQYINERNKSFRA